MLLKTSELILILLGYGSKSFALQGPLLLGGASQVVLVVKEPAYPCRRHKRCRFDPWVRKILSKGMATNSNLLTWRILWREEPGGLQSIWSHSRTQLKQFSMHTRTNAWYLPMLQISLLSIPHPPPPFSKLWLYWISLNATYSSLSWTFLCTLFYPYPLILS